VGSTIKGTYFIHLQDQDYDTGVVVWYGYDGLGFSSWLGAIFFLKPHPNWYWSQSSVLSSGFWGFFRIKWPEYEAVHSPSLLGLITGTTVPFTCTLLGQNVKILQHTILELCVLCVYTYIIHVTELVVRLNVRRELFWTVFCVTEFKPFT